MGALLESGLVGNIGLKHLKVIKEDTINKWDKLGFLDGLKGHVKENMAQLYENQASYLINEAAASDSSGSFETVVFPIVRRVFSKLLANDIVSVQAMNLPIGKLFYFVPKIQNRTEMALTLMSTGHHYGVHLMRLIQTKLQDSGYDSGKNLYDRFYEGDTPNSDPAGLFDYSKGNYTGLTDECVPVVWDGGELVRATCFMTTQVMYKSILVELSGFSSAGAGKLIGPDGQEMDTEDFLSSLEA